MRLALAIVSLAFVLVTLAAATFETEAGSPVAPQPRISLTDRTQSLEGDVLSRLPSGVALEPARVESTIWLSGQLGRDGSGWGTSAEEQARIAFRNLAAELERAGGSLLDVVDLTTYHRDLSSLEAFRQVKAEVFGPREPAWTAVEVTNLVEPESLIEIKATAVIRGRR